MAFDLIGKAARLRADGRRSIARVEAEDAGDIITLHDAMATHREIFAHGGFVGLEWQRTDG